ncbi:class I adenylate-forming enzyme family protein [Tropicibacter oceani]|uniref:Class I adenylate-forming enzyme family protein n=1 Tax=Tropicibacter oceani TaxID=3058420 RepID=A0ABY8QIR9_9RHOB|nr:class I adenylate-forming enzyme family protein [Tropicibacter oceani]WGW04515.1 class I adenylate-forming enzyme family protein [Tropicibacter oceani]
MIPHHLFLYQHLDHSAARRADHVAVQDTRISLTYGALRQEAVAIARRLQTLGVQPGDRVILLLENSVDFARAYWGAVYAGAVVTPLSVETKTDKLGFILGDCTPAAVIADEALTDEVHVALPADLNPAVISLHAPGEITADGPAPCAGRVIDQDLGCMIYTSGSTGHPKGVMLSHQNLTAAARSVCTYLGYTEDDRIFVTIPLTFDYGMHQLTMGALVGATVVIERNFASPLFTLDRLVKSGATCFPLVPTMAPLISALADRFDFSGIRLISSTAAALHPRVIDQLREIFSQATVFSMYGLTECHRCTYLPPDQLERRKGSVGIAIPNTEMWVEDSEGQRHYRDATGTLVIRGATVMKGYWNNPEKTAQRLRPGKFPGEFVLNTGDLCRLDPEGYLYFIARSDDVLKIRGEKVAPKEVEDALLMHPAVSEAVVVGRPDKVQGHQLHALVTLKPGMSPDPKELRDWCAQHLESIAVPRRVEIREAFARNANGKIDRNSLIDELA